MFRNIEEVKAAALANGSHWFDKATMRFFGSEIHGKVYGGRYFVSSELDFYESDRRYTIRVAGDDGSIHTLGDFRQFATLEEAVARIETLL